MPPEPLAIGENVLALLEDSAMSSTYKPALLVALIDLVPEHLDDGVVPVRDLAERVIELYWPQSRAYATSGTVLVQNQSGGQAGILRDLAAFRERSGLTSATLAPTARVGDEWKRLVDSTERTLAEWPIPRLQNPFEPFLYPVTWPFKGRGSFSMRAYRDAGAAIDLLPGVADALVRLGPLLRPFVVRRWAEKAAQLNRDAVTDAGAMLGFEDFLFGQDRVALGRVAEGLLDLQRGRCFYCARPLGARDREVDHFIPWSRSGDDGLDNLVVACRPCNSAKSATLAGPRHLEGVLTRNADLAGDLLALSRERTWPRDAVRTGAIVRAAYLRGSTQRTLWSWDPGAGAPRLSVFGASEGEIGRVLGAG